MLPAGARFVPNPFAPKQISRSSGVKSELAERAEDIASNARSIAPVRSGDYAASIRTQETTIGEDVAVLVLSDDWKAAFIEFGTGPVAPTLAYAPLRRGAEMAGFKVEGGRA